MSEIIQISASVVPFLKTDNNLDYKEIVNGECFYIIPSFEAGD